MTNGLAIHDNGCFNMRTLQEQDDATSLPLLGYSHLTLVTGIAYIVALRCQEEGELHLASLTVALHIRIEVERRVVERPRPLRIDSHLVAFAIGQHRPRQCNHTLLPFTMELPLATEIQRLLSIEMLTAEKG